MCVLGWSTGPVKEVEGIPTISDLLVSKLNYVLFAFAIELIRLRVKLRSLN